MGGTSVLQLIKVVCLGISMAAAAIAVAVPYWFIITLTWERGADMVEKNINMGLYFLERNMTVLGLVEKAGNKQLLPGFMKVAEIFFLIGTFGIIVTFVSSVIYFMRKYNTFTGELCLAAALIPTALSQLLGVIFAILGALIPDENAWHGFPDPSGYLIVQAHPKIAINFGLYIAALAAVCALVGLGAAWLQACILCKHVESVRYQMLHAPLSADERGVYEGAGRTYAFDTKPGFRYDGQYGKPGREMNF
ncbi:hypothetical protein MAR_032687 [Mya arenaria]|uniref:Uncharacterized protein n=1 Tax=Mya arenaria TaxID=6604 RepID=A0ABY7F7D8_MYAAR|nr:uncharacterized protein LOC128205827 [Mya arenaria]WAR18093.1 hypothetical protein MAR_032687 [Mya arenaria]